VLCPTSPSGNDTGIPAIACSERAINAQKFLLIFTETKISPLENNKYIGMDQFSTNVKEHKGKPDEECMKNERQE
jgi:hypothetical protein